MSRNRKSPSRTTGRNKSAPGHNGTGRLRIIGGQWRSRQLPVAAVEGLRPTPDRIRETLYNWLTGWVAGARCLDAFSGTGALGLEALSRGAGHTTFLEYSPVATRALRDNLATLTCTQAEVIQTDTGQWLQQEASTAFDLIFLDPPFHKGMVAPVCRHLQDNGYLNENALVYIESEIDLGLPEVPEQWQLWKEKNAGQVSCRLFRTR